MTTTGVGSFGLLATGVASQINVFNMNISTAGLDAFGVDAQRAPL